MDKRQIELKNTQGIVTGILVIDELNIIEVPTFVDYLRSGWGISLAVAIDFTGSNGDPKNSNSLHFLGDFN